MFSHSSTEQGDVSFPKSYHGQLDLVCHNYTANVCSYTDTYGQENSLQHNTGKSTWNLQRRGEVQTLPATVSYKLTNHRKDATLTILTHLLVGSMKMNSWGSVICLNVYLKTHSSASTKVSNSLPDAVCKERFVLHQIKHDEGSDRFFYLLRRLSLCFLFSFFYRSVFYCLCKQNMHCARKGSFSFYFICRKSMLTNISAIRIIAEYFFILSNVSGVGF